MVCFEGHAASLLSASENSDTSAKGRFHTPCSPGYYDKEHGDCSEIAVIQVLVLWFRL